ncbi:AAA family ATPase [Aeromonas sanarellii]|uniref:AAA family ATPase n=1 Tax=Aeromonas sanarellii TaxID=633415 RepID=UPI003B9E5D2D
MSLISMSFHKHPILGDLELDFSKDGKPISTIFIAGDNGTGKTTILNILYSLSNLAASSFNHALTLRFYLSQRQLDAINRHPNVNLNNVLQLGSILTIKIVPIRKNYWDDFTISCEYNGVDYALPPHLFGDNNISNEFKFIYSSAAINFTPKKIQTVTSKNLDESHTSRISNEDLATEITQLLIDVQSLDDADLSKWVRDNLGKAPTEDVIDQRMSRFRKAFSIIFPSKKYSEIRNLDDQKRVVFTDNGKECYIEQLSSGEKQIVFRGGFFLKDADALNDAVFIVDEPEISLHPNWQLKIMEYYKSVLNINSSNADSQLFVATHSPFIIHNHNRSDDKVIVLKKLTSGEIIAEQEPTFYNWTSEEVIKHAFDVRLKTLSDATLVLVEGETDEKYINAAAKILDIDLGDIDIKWVGHFNENGGAEFTGDKALNQSLAFITANPTVVSNPIILLYDSDTRKPDFYSDKVSTKSMPLKENNNFKIGIENLLVLPIRFDLSCFTKESLKTDGYGITSVIRALDKNKLCEHLISEENGFDRKEIFTNFSSLIQSLIDTSNTMKSRRGD